ncbi:MmcQ/YjbR family DNA-binding protein [Pontibacter sp. MBLB2868]|uniref:MmcQ/YjbR family DNA-binding protein n=1 Tax=Pontibacter sp. MBLB2868 TaxID=3451555 RepID=UPI003F755896
MNIEEFRDHCIAKAGVTEELPFDDDTLVFKVCGKMFALCSLSEFTKGIAVKCDPEKAIELREQYTQVGTASHMSKVHWNNVLPDAGLPDSLIRDWIDNSYQLVGAKLKKSLQKEIGLI